jgi:hypothetical protein
MDSFFSNPCCTFLSYLRIDPDVEAEIVSERKRHTLQGRNSVTCPWNIRIWGAAM